MAADEELIERAKKLRPGAVTAILQSQVAGVYRLSYALAGRWDEGRRIARFVLNRSVKMMPKWDANDDPANWYRGFTVQMSRALATHQADPKKDVLVEQAVDVDRAYIAFVSALRKLETQQREAFLLRHGERLNSRYMSLAMDCSTTAAETHLNAGESALRLVAGGDFDPMVRKLADAYQHLTPEEGQLLPTVNQVVLRRVIVRRWVKWIWVLVQLGILAAICLGAWKLWGMIRT